MEETQVQGEVTTSETASTVQADLTPPNTSDIIDTALSGDEGVDQTEIQSQLAQAEQYQQQAQEFIQNEDSLIQDLTSKGINYDSLAQEYYNTGTLSQSTLELLNNAGYPPIMVQSYINSLNVMNDRLLENVYNYVGGEEGYNEIARYVQQQPPELQQAYQNLIRGGDFNQIMVVLDGIRMQLQKQYGTSNKSYMGLNGNGVSHEGYTSMEQMTRDMADPRYQVDPQFTREVYNKINNSSIF